MKCDICRENEATIHLTEVVNEQVNKLHICESCARHKSEEMQSHFGLTDLLSGLVDLGESLPDDQVSKLVKTRCPVCNSAYQDFQRTGRVGCGKCYEVFSSNLSELLKKINGSDRHVGKTPFKSNETEEEHEDLQRLKSELSALAAAEEFEKAAVLRDRIKDMEERISNKGTEQA